MQKKERGLVCLAVKRGEKEDTSPRTTHPITPQIIANTVQYSSTQTHRHTLININNSHIKDSVYSLI